MLSCGQFAVAGLHGYIHLLQGGVFTQDLIDTWIGYKKKNEYDAVALRPHPYEFYLYYDI